MSSLAKQLKQLQIPAQLTGQTTKTQKHKASLLFSGREAADIDNETVFSLAKNGLQELQLIETSFQIFEESLFNDKAKKAERSLQTKDFNEKLDQQISHFLKLLSPYFLLKPAQKCLEWLIRRFRVHISNVDSLMACILPYHETNLFVRVVQLLEIRDPSTKWHWLLPLQKSGSPLSRATVLQRCISDLSFLVQVCEMVTNCLELECPVSSLRVLLGFYATTVVGALETAEKISEQMITRLLPFIIKGLKTKVLEYKAATYMIIAQTCLKCTLDDKLLRSLLDTVCKNLSLKLINDGLLCVTVICQTQSRAKLPKKAFKSLLKLDNFCGHLCKVAAAHDITALIQALLPQLVSAAVRECVPSEGVSAVKGPFIGCLNTLLRDLELASDMVKSLSRVMLEDYCKIRNTIKQDKASCKTFHKNLKGLPQFLEKRYPSELEKAVEEYLEGLKSEGENDEGVVDQHSEWTLEFMSLALSGFQAQLVPGSGTTWVLSLNHPKSDVRLMAVNYLNQMLNEKEGLCDAEFLSTTLLARITDDSPGVVCAVLNMNKILIEVIPSDLLVDKLLHLLNNKDVEWKEAREKAVSILTGTQLTADDPMLQDKVVFGLVSLLFLDPHSHGESIALAKATSQSPLAESHPLLAGMKTFIKRKDWKACGDSSDPTVLAAGNLALICWLGDQLAKMKQSKRMEMVSKLIEYSKSNPSAVNFHLLINCCLGRMMSSANVDKDGVDLCEKVLSILAGAFQGLDKLKPVKETDNDLSAEHAEKGLVPLSFMSQYVSLLKRNKTKKTATVRAAINLWLLGNFARNTPVITSASSDAWWSCQDNNLAMDKYTRILVSTFEILVHGSGSTSPVVHQNMFRDLLQEFIKVHLPNKLTLLKFLALVWSSKSSSSDTSQITPMLQVQSLHIGSMCLRVIGGQDVKSIMSTTNTAVASLLVPLCNPILTIRKRTVACFRSLLSAIPSPPPAPVGTLVALIAENAEELEADPGHMQRLLASVFSPLSLLEAHAGTKPKGKSKKKSEQTILLGMLEYILSQAVCIDTPIYIQRSLLCILSEVITKDVLCLSLLRMEELVNKSQSEGKLTPDEGYCLQYMCKKYSAVTAGLLATNPDCLRVFESILSLTSPVCAGRSVPTSFLLDQVDNNFFQAISSNEIQQKILAMLVDLQFKTKDVTIASQVKGLLAKLDLEAAQVIEELSTLKIEPKTPKRKKVKRKSPSEEASLDELQTWQRITILLELLQHKHNINHRELLIPSLFALLSRCVELDVPEQVNSDYIKQLLLAEVQNICQLIMSTGNQDVVPENQFNVELVVQCIRVSENPQTHHHALLLLAAAAKIFPEKVLHNVMSIFTFMGANILRQDDQYSFQVISKTVDTVIPALIQAGEKQRLPKLQSKSSPPTSLDDIVAMVIRVFVDASPHIPQHRRLPVFSHLVSTVGAQRFLHTTVLLLMESCVVHSTVTQDEEGKTHVPLGVDFCLALCQEFDSSVQAAGMLNLLRYLTKLPMEKPEGHHRPRSCRKSALFSGPLPLFDAHVHSAKHLRQFKFMALGFIPTVLSSEAFTLKEAELGDTTSKRMSDLYVGFIEELLRFITITARYTETKAEESTKKFWRALLHKAYDVVDKVNQLLPVTVFIAVIRRLIQNENATVRRKAMELLNTKLGHFTVTKDQEEELLGLTGDLITLVQRTDSGEETAVNRQTALYSLKLLARLLAEQHPDTFSTALEVTIVIFVGKEENIQVASNALLCLAEVFGGLKTSAIPFLPKFMPDLLKLLKQTTNQSNTLLLLCGLVAVHKVLETLPNFLSPYLEDILIQVSCQSASTTAVPSDGGEHVKESSVQNQLRERLAALRKDVARVITPRVLVPCVSKCFTSLLDTQRQDAILSLLDVVIASVTNMNMRDVTSHTDQLFKFFLVALDFRVTQPQSEPGVVDNIEGKVIESFLCLVMKMSEASFRPVFLKLMDWATRSNADKHRLLVFYRLCVSIADKLRGLMSLFAGYVLKNCALLLEANKTSKSDKAFFEGDTESKKSNKLVTYILDCLQKCLLFSTKGFIDKERFDCLMEPIINQLENESGNKEEFQERITGHVVPCIAQLAVASGSEVYWKPLNYQVLLKTRHTSPQVRFAALKALEELHRQLGEEFLVLLLPESIPFLAELMEDECFEVEQHCQHVVSEIEGVLGEPLQKYFET